ncbi:MAG: hypothetical protein ACKV19_05690 [Verrucomicrobiales bacterium]
MRTRLDLHGMLRPAVQPGSSLDHVPPPERVTVVITSPTTPFTVEHGRGRERATTASKPGQVTHDCSSRSTRNHSYRSTLC